MNFLQTWFVNWYCRDLVWDCLGANFVNFWHSYLPATHSNFLLRTITSKSQRLFLPYLKCAVTLWRSGLGLHLGTLRQFLTELSPHDTIMAGYYRFTVLFTVFSCKAFFCVGIHKNPLKFMDWNAVSFPADWTASIIISKDFENIYQYIIYTLHDILCNICRLVCWKWSFTLQFMNHRRQWTELSLRLFGRSTCYLFTKASSLQNITKTCLYKFDPLKPHFYRVKLGFTGVYIIFLSLLKKTQIVGTR